MKQLVRVLILGFAITLFSCSDPCEDVNCENGGVCDDGTCLCETGYSGARCELESRLSFLGEWSGTVNCSGGDESSGSFIASTSEEGIDKLLLTFDDGSTAIACATSSTSLVIPPFTVVDPIFGLNVTTSGTGTLVEEELTLDIEIVAPGFGTSLCQYICSQ